MPNEGTIDYLLSICADAANALMALPGFTDEHFSCEEAQAFAKLIECVKGKRIADEWLAWHADSDDEGDDHYNFGGGS